MGLGKMVARKRCLEYADYSDSRLSPPREEVCPNCGQEIVEEEMHKHCPDCGWEIRWDVHGEEI